MDPGDFDVFRETCEPVWIIESWVSPVEAYLYKTSVRFIPLLFRIH